jgi:molecular chaperone GrpE
MLSFSITEGFVITIRDALLMPNGPRHALDSSGDMYCHDTNPSLMCEQAEVSPPEMLPRVALDDVSACTTNVQEQLTRLQADFINFRRRAADIADRAAHDRAVEIVALLLPVIDNLERALGTETTDAPYSEGVRLTYRQLMGTLASIGLEPVRAAGEAFDPRIHEALRRIGTDELPEGTVLEELRKGYLLNGTLLRPAQVSVAASLSGG